MKTIIGPYPTMAVSNFAAGQVVTSSVSDVRRIDDIGIQLIVSGTPAVTGTVTIQASVDYQFSAPSAAAAVVGSGTWFTVTSSLFTASLGSTTTTNGPLAFSFVTFAYPFIRTIFSGTGGAGSGSVFISGKSIGA